MFYNGHYIELSIKGDKLDESRNYIIHENVTYILKPLSKDYPTSKGGNSSVFDLFLPDEEKATRVIKISNWYKPNRNTRKEIIRRHGRFITEIEVLNKARDANFEKIVEIEFDGILELGNKRFPYYVMEKADYDLKEFIYSEANQLDEQEKVKFCIQLFISIKQLFSLNYYHRDIKPDNVFLFIQGETEDLTWKIGDLGLAQERDRDDDGIGEKIGPFGWISPEAMNKFLTEKYNRGFDCKIDEKSDIFQLGKIFWFIFIENCPIGEIYRRDFTCEMKHKRKFLSIILSMLSYSKSRRPNLEYLELKLDNIAVKYGL